ncbi:hypothetical protein HHK36_007982 [Tetracentron sinense]|uniref:Uncharacterized protein n=1 Tax=Tetracentron sinense TaxID=13715 RepID=A0A835DMZ5_TETSI|nr:hypothetical protein HHK36_007982 [Tetracentron sinense]
METVLSTSFWKGMVYAMKITAPLVRVLRLVDGEKRPPMGYIYEAIDKAKEAMKEALGGQMNDRRSRLQGLQRGIDDEPLSDEAESNGEEQYIEEANNNDSDGGDDEIEDESLLDSLLDEDDE